MVQDSGHRRVFKKGLSNTSLSKKDENNKEKKKITTEMTNDGYFSSSTFVTEAEDINIFMGSFPKPSVYSIISDIFISLGSHFQTFIYKFWALVMLFSCLNRERKNNVYVLHHLGTTYGRRRPSFRRLAPATITVDDGTALGLNTSK